MNLLRLSRLSILVYILITIGCLAQLYQISYLYLQYETVTLMSMSRPEYVNPPLVYLCSNVKEMIFEEYTTNIKEKSFNHTLTIQEVVNSAPHLESSNMVGPIIIHSNYNHLIYIGLLSSVPTK